MTTKFDRLPKWAKTEIERLQANELYYKKQLARALGENTTPIEIDPPYGDDTGPRKFIGVNSRIEFTLPSGKIEVHLNDGHVVLYAEGGDGILIRPSANNVVRAAVVSAKSTARRASRLQSRN